MTIGKQFLKKQTPRNLRADERFFKKMIVICRPYSSVGNVCTAKGVMHNFSSQGSYFEINRDFKPGTILIVRTLDCSQITSTACSCEYPPSICLGEIKWRQDLDRGEAPFYGMGLRYLN